MPSLIRPALVLFGVLSVVTGIVYPFAITAIARVAFAEKANGSLIASSDGKILGSRLIGQEFSTGEPKEAAKWFWGRPSATSPVPYSSLNLDKGTGSSGSNLAPTNPTLLENLRARVSALAAADSAVGYARPATQAIPIDLVSSSASGLDPHISPSAAKYQLPRVAKARGIGEEALRELIAKHTTPRTAAILGEPVVNVLELNLALQNR